MTQAFFQCDNTRKPGCQGNQVSTCAGFTIIEVVVGAAILVGVFISVGGIANYAVRLSSDANLRIRSAFLATEGIEAAKAMRDRSWEAYIAPQAPGTNYYLAFSADRWLTSQAPEIIDGIFTRTIQFENVSRASSDDIVMSGGTNDPNIKKVTVTVRWASHGILRQDSIATYITNLLSN